MRSQEEIERAFLNVGEHEGDGSKPLDWKGDNFRYGYFIGKAAALGWVLGDANTADINANYDYEDFVREQISNRGE